MLNDFTYAMRLLLNNPRFSALTIFVMTTGLALCIFMFSFINGTLNAPLPFENGDRMRNVTIEVNGTAYDSESIRMHEYEDIKKVQQSFETLDAYSSMSANVSTGDKVVRYVATKVTPKFFELSEGKAQLGRLINQNDLLPGAGNLVVLSDAMWRELFAADIDVIGRRIRINTEPYTVIGVTQQGYSFPNSANLYVPMRETTQGISRENSPMVTVYGVLKPGVSDQQVATEVREIFHRFAEQYPKLNSNSKGYVWTPQEASMGSGTRPILIAMQLSVVLILVLACTNVGNLLLSRAGERNKETAIRTALGAPRSKLIVQLMWESGLICVISGFLAILFAGLGLSIAFTSLTNSFPIPPPFWWQVEMGTYSYLLALVVVAVTALLTGALPAWRATSGDINAVLRDGTRGAQSKSSGLVSKVIVIFEVALSCILITLSVAMVNYVHELNSTDYGMDTEGYLTARVYLPGTRYETPEQRQNYYNQLEATLVQNANVSSVTFTQSLPSTWASFNTIMLDGVDYGVKPNYPSTNMITVSENFFSTMGIQLLEGRLFASMDRINTQPVAIVTQDFADQFFKGENAIGKRFKAAEGDNKWLTIVGVVNNVNFGQPFDFNLRKTDVFMLYRQQPKLFMNIAIKTSGDANNVRTALDQAIVKLDQDVPAYSIITLKDGIAQRIAGVNFVSKIFMVFAVASMVLAFSGIYGVMANAIIQKTQEVGVRRALGADDAAIRIHFLVNAAKQMAIGLVIGVPIGVMAVKILEQANIARGALEVYIAVPSLIAIVILLAVILPVQRTLHIEPAFALRNE